MRTILAMIMGRDLIGVLTLAITVISKMTFLFGLETSPCIILPVVTGIVLLVPRTFRVGTLFTRLSLMLRLIAGGTAHNLPFKYFPKDL